MITGDPRIRNAWEVPNCPGCGGHVFVWGGSGGLWQCSAPECDQPQFDAPDPLDQ